MAWQLRKVIENKKEEYIIQDKSKVIFNNEIDRKAYRKAINSKKNTQENMVMTAMPTIR